MAETNKVTKICKHCKSEDVVKDAWVSWNIETQAFDTIHNVFDLEYCNNCEGETTIIDKDE